MSNTNTTTIATTVTVEVMRSSVLQGIRFFDGPAGVTGHRGMGWSTLLWSFSERHAHRREYAPVIVAVQNRMAVASCEFQEWAHI